MYPLFVPGRDQAVVAPVDTEQLKREDVVLYRRDESILVMHCVWKHKGDQFYLVGDNQKEVEGPLRPDQMRVILVEIIRNGRLFAVKIQFIGFCLLHSCCFGHCALCSPI